MDVTFFENKSYSHKNYLQGENKVMEENFWNLPHTSLPNTILPTSPYSSHPIVTPGTECDETNGNNERNPSYIVPSISVSESREETL